MLKLPTVVTREIDGFLPAADAVKRGLVAKESPEPVGVVGAPLGGELIMQTGNGAEFTKSESEEVSFVELRVNGEPAVAPGPAGLGSIALVKKNQMVEIRDNNGDGLQLSREGWSVCTWTKVKDGEIERPGHVPDDGPWFGGGHALLAGGDVPAYYTSEGGPRTVFLWDEEYQWEQNRWGQRVRTNYEPPPNRDTFGVLLSTWEEQRQFRGRECETDGAEWHFEPSGTLSLSKVSDGWHHIVIVGDDKKLSYFIDGKDAGSMRMEAEPQRDYRALFAAAANRPAPGTYERLMLDRGATQEQRAKAKKNREVASADEWASPGSWGMSAIGNTDDEYGGAIHPWGIMSDFRIFNRKLSAGEINHFLYKPVAAKLPPKPPANIGDLVNGPKGRAFVRSIDVENQTMSLKAVGGGTTRKTPWAQVSGKIAI